MRALILVSLVYSLSAATVEVFTLTDGRTFVGQYDAEAHRLKTAVGKQEALLAVEPGDIVDRKPFKGAAPLVEGKKDAAPAPMTKEEKEAALKAYAYQSKLREAERLEAEAEKATRDAAQARKESADKLEQAKRDGKKFRERADLEGFGVSVGDSYRKLMVLPRTMGNNRAAFEGYGQSEKLKERAAEYDELAKKKKSAAEQARNEAEQMPRP